MIVGAAVLVMLLALTAAAAAVGQEAVSQAFPGERAIEVQGNASTFGVALQELEITSSEGGSTVEEADAAFSGNLKEP